MIGFLCFLVVLVLIATATEYALNHQMVTNRCLFQGGWKLELKTDGLEQVSFDISSSVNILIRGEEDPQPAGAHGDEEAMPVCPYHPAD